MTTSSKPVQPEELDTLIEVRAGRRAPFSQLGDWVAMSGVDDHAKSLYWLLSMHVSMDRTDCEVWPAQEVLGVWMGFRKVESITPYADQLVAIGAIDVEHRWYASNMRTRNRYTVHQMPPASYAGPVSLKDFYELRRANPGALERWYEERRTWLAEEVKAVKAARAAAAKRRPQSVKPAGEPVPRSSGVRTPSQRDTEISAPKRKTAGRHVPRSSGERTPPQRGSVPRSSGVEQDEVQQDPPSVLPSVAGAVAREASGTDGRKDGGATLQEQHERPADRDAAPPAASPGLALLLELGRREPRLAVAGKVLVNQALRVDGLLAASWEPAQLLTVLSAELPPAVRSAGAVLSARIGQLPAAPPPFPRQRDTHSAPWDNPGASRAGRRDDGVPTAHDRTTEQALHDRTTNECTGQGGMCGRPIPAPGALCRRCSGPECASPWCHEPAKAGDPDGLCATCGGAAAVYARRTI